MEKPPWQRSWWYASRGEWPTLAWIAGLHVVVLAGVVPLGIPPWPIVVLSVVLLALGGLGTTVAYHRALAHRALRLAAPVESILIGAAMFNGSGAPLSWVANHRDHHAHSDTIEDISSPRHGGFWWAHLRWLWQTSGASTERYAPDLLKRGMQRWSKWQVPFLAVSALGWLALAPFIGWPAALSACLWLGPLRLLFALHVQCSVNSLCHLGVPRARMDSSKNVWWMAPLHLGQGENWHANHHSSAGNARLGRRWWQIDTGWWLIAALERCGLAHDVRRSRTATSLPNANGE